MSSDGSLLFGNSSRRLGEQDQRDSQDNVKELKRPMQIQLRILGYIWPTRLSGLAQILQQLTLSFYLNRL